MFGCIYTVFRDDTHTYNGTTIQWITTSSRFHHLSLLMMHCRGIIAGTPRPKRTQNKNVGMSSAPMFLLFSFPSLLFALSAFLFAILSATSLLMPPVSLMEPRSSNRSMDRRGLTARMLVDCEVRGDVWLDDVDCEHGLLSEEAIGGARVSKVGVVYSSSISSGVIREGRARDLADAFVAGTVGLTKYSVAGSDVCRYAGRCLVAGNGAAAVVVVGGQAPGFGGLGASRSSLSVSWNTLVVGKGFDVVEGP